jgi:hypothetical protein
VIICPVKNCYIPAPYVSFSKEFYLVWLKLIF